MMTALIDLLTTASAIGLVSSFAALGIAVLPWSACESEHAGEALDSAVRLPAHALGLSPTPEPAPVAVCR